MKIFAVIPAGGKGVRSGFSVPKQYLKFNGKELIVYTLETFQKNKLINEIIISADKAYFSILNRIKTKYKLAKINKIVEGGNERQDSVFNALTSLSADKNDLIVVHDAARPLLSSKILTEAITVAKKKGNALVCVKAKDTIIKGNKIVDEYISREEIYYVQTPQIFKYGDLMDAMENAYENNFYGTDESMLVKNIGKKINLVEGSFLNFKITTKSDIDLFKQLI
ncbi:MAG: 2-C-methyl-D-erythritol 4-phosphate cytidylyltransferase [Bacteroidetes bacterium]|nr:2-C-methyl-D-erythritol 4-phosphate cytidylyltransferase [Bacteroidota bacterium]